MNCARSQLITSTPVVDVWGPVAPGARSSYPPAPEPHDEWNLAGGTACVYYSPLNRRQPIRPVIVSDGFSAGSCNLDQPWHGLEENGDYRFVSELHATGRDVIILGYADRTASIADDADTAVDCIRRAVAERVGRAKLAVGGFSVGGMVTRYALAKMEHDPGLPDHETSLYFSTRVLSGLLNSPAAKQMARWHIEKADDAPQRAPERVEFLQKLDELGDGRATSARSVSPTEWPPAPAAASRSARPR